jgi:hypothetical protein
MVRGSLSRRPDAGKPFEKRIIYLFLLLLLILLIILVSN